MTRGVDPEGDYLGARSMVLLSYSNHAISAATTTAEGKSDSSAYEFKEEEEQNEGSLVSIARTDQFGFDNDSFYQEEQTQSAISPSLGPPHFWSQRNYEQEESDRALAEQLQTQFNDEHSEAKTADPSDSVVQDEGNFGLALRFTKLLAAQHTERTKRFAEEYGADNPSRHISLVDVDDIVFLAEKFFSKQREFDSEEKDTAVDAGYHYTHSANMHNIRRDGLLSNRERMLNVVPNVNGINAALFGDGIYTGNNPYSYHMFAGADRGLLVARVKGSVEAKASDVDVDPNDPVMTDTLLGRAGMTDETCVLRSGAQCLPLIQFHSDLVNISDDKDVGNKIIYETHRQVQELLDQCFNEGKRRTKVKVLKPSQVAIRKLKHVSPNDILVQQITSLAPSLREILFYEAPTRISATVTDSGFSIPTSAQRIWIDTKANPTPLVVSYESDGADTFPVSCGRWLPKVTCTSYEQKGRPSFQFSCNSSFEMVLSRPNRGWGRPVAWGEVFDHPSVLKKLRKTVLAHCKGCRTCASERHQGNIAVGLMPTGTMRVDVAPEITCAGHAPGAYLVSYRFEKGKQESYHKNPGQPYAKTYRVAYVPQTYEGWQLVSRLKSAFVMGLTFKIDRSLTSGKDNSIVWSSIPHKTVITSGPFGFPDQNYFASANAELDKLGVPPASDSC